MKTIYTIFISSLETFWQSDGLAPHFINIQFLKKVAVSEICFYLDFNLDESYTGMNTYMNIHGNSYI